MMLLRRRHVQKVEQPELKEEVKQPEKKSKAESKKVKADDSK
jgi:hypothetical protein